MIFLEISMFEYWAKCHDIFIVDLILTCILNLNLLNRYILRTLEIGICYIIMYCIQTLTYTGHLMTNFNGIEGKTIVIRILKSITATPSTISAVQIQACTQGNATLLALKM